MAATYIATVRHIQGMQFAARTGSGHEVVMDAAVEAGGQEQGPRPMELLLASLGGCGGMDVISILRKMRQEVTAYEVRVSGERAADHPRVFTRITVEHVVTGRDLDEALVRRAVELARDRYCSVSAMLARSAEVTHIFRLQPAEPLASLATSAT